MGEDQGTAGPQVTTGQDPEQLREEIEATRQELGDTVEALAAKADVKALAHEKVERAKESVARPPVIGAAVAIVVGLIAWRLIKRRRR
jgi:ElaB/YqjD/DUF883 family membrane-anchored ribosome-binding protein